MEIEEMLESGMSPEEVGQALLKEDNDIGGWKQYLGIILHETDGDIEYEAKQPRLPQPSALTGLTVDDFFPRG